MVTSIKASCTDCGEVSTTSTDVVLLFCSDIEETTYAFQCPQCRQIVVKPADENIVKLLSPICQRRVWQLPASDKLPTGLPPLTSHDEYDLRLSLQDDEAVARELQL